MKISTLVLTHTPTDERCEQIALALAEQEGMADQHISWLVTDVLPPTLHAVHVRDQLEATKRDTPGGTFLTILMENAPH